MLRAMAVYFGVPTSSAGIELDFYFAGLLITKQRTSLLGPQVEMMHMFDRNQKWVDLTQVDVLTKQAAKDVRPVFAIEDDEEYKALLDAVEDEDMEYDSDRFV